MSEWAKWKPMDEHKRVFNPKGTVIDAHTQHPREVMSERSLTLRQMPYGSSATLEGLSFVKKTRNERKILK
jgi:hypothetical protein